MSLAPNVPDERFLAWAAGFFDGEGSISITTYRRAKPSGYITHQQAVRVSASQIREEPLRKLKSMFGGTIVRWHRPDRRRAVKQWVATSRTACRFLESVIPYLTVKRRPARLALAFSKTIRSEYRLSEEMDAYRDRLRSCVKRHNNGRPV